MPQKPDYRDLIVDCPACKAAVQTEFLGGTTYDDFEPLLRSVRKGSIVRVYRPFLLGGGYGRTDKQRRIWAERADAIRDKGGKLESIEPCLTDHALAMHAFEEISLVARGRAGKPKAGRPVKDYTPEQVAVIRQHWPRRHGVKVLDALNAINATIKPRKVTLSWLYANVK